MRNLNPLAPYKTTAGFALPAILVVVGALLILAVGVILIAGVERSTSRSFSDQQKAAFVANAGLEEVRATLGLEAANDDFVILQSTLEDEIEEGTKRAPNLFLARGKVEGANYKYRYLPLFSTKEFPAETSKLEPPLIEPLVGDTKDVDFAEFSTLPYTDKVRAAWIPVKDDKDRMIGRYAYWVEDLQGKIDPAVAGNEEGGAGVHARAAWPFPAAGLNPESDATDKPALNQVALFAVDPTATADNQGEIGKTLMKNRQILISPDSLLAAAGLQPPMTRLKETDADAKIGELADIKARAVEEGLVSGLKPYKEQPVVPFAEGIDPSMAGKPKLNLNKLIASGGSSSVDEMSDFINKALPNFVDRKGAFPDDYVKTIAANAIDYADADPSSTLGTGYRGVDAYPFVSEFLMRFIWESIEEADGRKYAIITATTYVELWNMSDQPITGSAEFTHATKYKMDIGVSGEPFSLEDLSVATPELKSSDDSYWFPPRQISLKPNEYLLVKAGTVRYRVDGASASGFILGPISLDGEAYTESRSGYKLKWNGQIVDEARGFIHRNTSSLTLRTTKVVRASVPQMSSKSGPAADLWVNGMGDPRMSYYNTVPQDASAYPGNYSPNRRNIRFDSIYNLDTAKVYGRTMPSEWPDGGHNSTCAPANAMQQTDKNMDPEAPVFIPAANSILRNPEVDEAPFRLSNKLLGDSARFYSATELGRVYDPVIWQVAQPPIADSQWGDVDDSSQPKPGYGGGNTLRIGRPEHPKFNDKTKPGMEAYHLLDLFHAGLSRSPSAVDREGPVVEVRGQVNINTASRDTLRAIAYGQIMMDPKLERRGSGSHDKTAMRPRVIPLKMSNEEIKDEASRIADAIIATRSVTPFASTAALAETRENGLETGRPVFGNTLLSFGQYGEVAQISDSATEEVFARVYEASTVRSRNFRIWVVGQALAPSPSNSISQAPEVLGEVRKAYTVFADPGERDSEGKIDTAKTRLTIIHESDF